MQKPVVWQVRTPFWVWFVTVTVLLLVSLILVFQSFVLFLSATLATFLCCRRRVVHSLFARGSLRFENGGWFYDAHHGSERQVLLKRVWPNAFWTTLRFTQEASGANEIMELTVWKSRVPEQAWRALGMLVAQHIAAAGGVRERA
ncbi:hypothetical protein [Neopusillimonas maritima]|jgi:hypothetical protein|uniref:DUF2244 domain-containing protein n=1 Tax=Neopusillimonas maritima TaxID=2026239 RepID=A0ABX9MZW4_9BURK|nr:hypothetical protein [Neopusillimonas maritima]MAL00939.1 hypothetical protein [Alcaligenaceae bacterium]RII84098.1 hypothetical protein CJO09_02370 [Neopusillimonas maritima]